MNVESNKLNIVIIGGGMVGLTTALALSNTRHDITLCAPAFDFSNSHADKNINTGDGRSTALLAHSVDYLKKLGIWDDLAANAFPLKIMRIIDDTNRLIRAPQIDFKSSEIELNAFGYNILNQEFTKALVNKLKNLGQIKFTDQLAISIAPGEGSTKIILEDNSEMTFDLVLACDGRNSPTRAAYNIDFETKKYPQIAVVGNIEHTLPHHDISTEFHTPTGPFTLVPMGNNQSSFVCVENEETATKLTQLTKPQLEIELEERSHSVLGKISLTSKLQQFPLSYSNNTIFSNRNMMMLGEAAHVLPPIGAQGFNIGIRDIEAIETLLNRPNMDPIEIANGYQKSRLIDVKSRSGSVDIFNRSLLSDFLPTQLARSFGLYALGAISPLRKFAMKEGVEPGRGLSQLFQKPSK